MDLNLKSNNRKNIRNIEIYYLDGNVSTLDIYEHNVEYINKTLSLGSGIVDKVRVNLKENTKYEFYGLNFYAIEIEDFITLFDIPKIQKDFEFSDDGIIKAKLSIDEASIITTSIPTFKPNYNWEVVVDGVKLEKTIENFGFLSFYLDKGIHDVEISFNDVIIDKTKAPSSFITLLRNVLGFITFAILAYGVNKKINIKKLVGKLRNE